MDAFQEFLTRYFLEGGVGWAMIGAAAAVGFGCVGSARGIRIAAGQSAGVLSEKPDMFGKLLVLMALPGTQGFYSFVCAIMIAVRVGLLKKAVALHPTVGVGIMAMGIGAGFAFWKSAVYQGETSAAAANMVAKQPDTFGRSILMPALVETYALVALLAALLMIIFLTAEGVAIG